MAQCKKIVCYGASGDQQPHFLFWTPLLSLKLIELESWYLVRWLVHTGTRTLCKNLSTRGIWGQQPPISILGPLHYSQINRARKL